MGFLLRDIHQRIKKKHAATKQTKPFPVYRGQRMSSIQLRKIKNNMGGLLAFNNFLSTTRQEETALTFAKPSSDPDTIGIIFKMTIDPSISSTPFASTQNETSSPGEEEILFSVHTVFRIRSHEQIKNSLWQIELELTADNDQELKELTEYIQKDTSTNKPWHRLGALLIQMGHLDQAEKLYQVLLKQIPDDDQTEASYLYHQLGCVECKRGAYKNALAFSQEASHILQKLYPSNHPLLADTYCNIGLIYAHTAAYQEALKW
jgi:hypothetical protein